MSNKTNGRCASPGPLSHRRGPIGRSAARRRPLAAAAAVAAGTLLLTSDPTRATTYQWDRTAGTIYNWSDAGNWSGGTVPNDPAAVVTFDGVGNLTGGQTIVANNQTCGEVILGDVGSTYRQIISGVSANPQPTLRMGTAGGTALVYANGGGTDPSIILPLVLNGSSLRVQSYYQALSANPNNAYSENFSFTDGITGCVNLEVNHAVVDVAYAVSMTGTTTLDGGYASLKFDTSNVLPATTAVTVADATDQLQLAGTAQQIASLSGVGTVSLGGGTLAVGNFSGTFSSSPTGTFAGSFTGGGGLTVGPGRLALTNASAGFTGAIAVNGSSLSAATLAVNADAALGATSAPVTLNGGTLESTASFTLNHTLTLVSTGLLTTDAGTTLTAAAPVAGGGTLFKEGTGTLVLANAGNSFQGLILDAGAVQFSADADLGTAGGQVRLGGLLELSANNAATTNRTTTLAGGSFAVDGGSTLTWNGQVTETPSTNEFPNHQVLTDNGLGTLVLTNANNNYSGGTVVNGTVSISADGDLGAAGTGVTFGLSVTTGQFHFIVPGTLVTTQTIGTNRPVTLGTSGGTVSPAAGTALFLDGVVAGGSANDGLAVSGPGTVYLTAVNTFAGGVYLTAGTLQVSSDANLGAATGGITFGGGSLEWFFVNGNNASARPVDLGPAAAGGGTVGVDPAGSALTLSGPITDAGPLTKAGAGALNLTGANTFTGGVRVTAGTLGAGPVPAGSSGSPLGTGTVTLAGGTLALQGGVAQSAAQQQLTCTGYNQDVVVEQGATNYRAAVTTAFDSSNASSGYAFYEAGYPGSGSTGLPHVGHSFTSASNSAVSFTLQPYAGNNVLLLPGGGGGGTLTLGNPGVFSTIQVLAAAVNGAAAVDATLYFTDGTTATVPVTVPDWFANAPYAISPGGRISLVDGSLQQVAADPKLYEVDVAVPAAYAGRAVSSVSFTDLTTSTGNAVGVFGLSGTGGTLLTNQYYLNPFVVTADSTINVTGSPYVTLGPLTIGNNALSVAGVPGAFVALGTSSTTINGTATFNVAPAVELEVGTVTGGGVVKANAGDLFLGNDSVLSSLTIRAGAVHANDYGTALVTGSLTIAGSTNAWTGTLTIANGDLIVRNGNLANVSNQIRTGYDNGANDGTGIRPLSYVPNQPIYGSATAGSLGIASFDGITVAPADVLVRATVFGDANLDGVVNGADYARIDAGYLSGGTLTGWANGDFNYDGKVDASDYTLIDNAFNTQPRASGGIVVAAATDDVAAVPEPAAAAIVALAGLVLPRRRRVTPAGT